MANKGGGFLSVILGAVVGAAAVLLSDKKNRDKVSKTVKKYAGQVEETVKEGKKVGREKIKMELDKASKKLAKLSK